MKKIFIPIALATSMLWSTAQENLSYQKPVKEILDLVDVPLAPYVLMPDDKSSMLLIYRDVFKSIEELSQEEMRLGGLRIDPKTNISSRANYFNNIKIQSLTQKKAAPVQVTGLPENAKLTNFTWSPDQSKIAMTNTSSNGVSVWIVDLKTVKASRVTTENVNANLGDPIQWYEDNQSLLVKMVSSKKQALINTKEAIPSGPTISVNDGKKAQNRTYQDLLSNKNDEHNFEQLALSEVYQYQLNGERKLILNSDLYDDLKFSPDGEYLLVSTINKPFSYIVTYRRFPSTTSVYTKTGQFIETIVEKPLLEELPQGFMATQEGRRDVQWRDDLPASIIFAMALDKGDPEVEVEYRDEVFQLNAPFNGTPKSLIKTINRFSGIRWGNESIAIAYDYWWNTRNTKVYLFNPSLNTQPTVLFDRNYQDKYSDPGSFEMKRNQYGSNVLALRGSLAYLKGDGFTEKGQFPFLDQYDLNTLKSTRLYQSKYTDKIEDIRGYDIEKNELEVKIESATEYPNYYFRNLKNNQLRQVTAFENPFKSIQGVHKEVINYKREDGLELSGTLYLPVGYDRNKKEKMPMIMWAYPTEYKDKASAGQNTSNPNEFTYPYYGSPIYWVNRGYVVLDDASFPIVGEGDTEPNDSFRKQLVDNAKAAIDAVDQRGYIDRNRVAVGGHSYGAFMVANLLSHSDLFAAGIARSGAYNRTLTPFGFQSEERNYWEAPDVYNTMSPFMHADKMKTPLLLVHGEADNNSGTYPMQSERYFNALKGLGATVRLVILPKESHGYRAKESVLHLLWEQDQWLETHVKNKTMTLEK